MSILVYKKNIVPDIAWCKACSIIARKKKSNIVLGVLVDKTQ